MLDFEKKLLDYIGAHTSPEDELLAELGRETHLKVLYPRMLSGHYQGKCLELLSKMLRPNLILEIGTFTGYSAICLAKGLAENGTLHTIEYNDEIAGFITKYFQKSGFEKKIKLHIGDALEIIPSLNFTFDLVFIDAEKTQYIEYYHTVFEKVKVGGIILADNVLWDGKVLNDDSNCDNETKIIKRFNDLIQEDNRVENILLPIRDGLTIIRKIKD